MAETARVTSVASLTRFLGALRAFTSKARVTIDDVSDDVRKTKQWLEHDRLPCWNREIRERTKKLEAARQELFTAQLSGVGADTQFQQAAVNRAQRALAEAEQKLRQTRKWIREFDTVVGPVSRQLDKMDAILVGMMPRAYARLNEMIKALEAYAAVQARPVSLSATPDKSPTELPAAESEEPDQPTDGSTKP